MDVFVAVAASLPKPMSQHPRIGHPAKSDFTCGPDRDALVACGAREEVPEEAGKGVVKNSDVLSQIVLESLDQSRIFNVKTTPASESRSRCGQKMRSSCANTSTSG
ncbi:MAG: hypothetical protein IH623_19915 [Verrucomicrobia bacterium]|nr:hypothetical protein [Verrucomicrobiota bacterium]